MPLVWEGDAWAYSHARNQSRRIVYGAPHLLVSSVLQPTPLFIPWHCVKRIAKEWWVTIDLAVIVISTDHPIIRIPWSLIEENRQLLDPVLQHVSDDAKLEDG